MWRALQSPSVPLTWFKTVEALMSQAFERLLAVSSKRAGYAAPDPADDMRRVLRCGPPGPAAGLKVVAAVCTMRTRCLDPSALHPLTLVGPGWLQTTALHRQ